jgi:hypothetical protein
MGLKIVRDDLARKCDRDRPIGEFRGIASIPLVVIISARHYGISPALIATVLDHAAQAKPRSVISASSGTVYHPI